LRAPVAERHLGGRNTRTIPTQVLTKKDNPFYTLRPGRHAHNVFLQIWLELGGIGALLFCVLGIAVLWQLQFWPSLVEAGAYGLFAAVAAIGLSGFDLWQTWLIASLALAWIAMLLAARLPVAWQGFRKPA
jgi:O-antigen ligase